MLVNAYNLSFVEKNVVYNNFFLKTILVGSPPVGDFHY